MHCESIKTFQSIKSLVAEDSKAVDFLILTSLQSEASIINELGNYIIQAGGKRIRPLLVLLIAKACGYTGQAHIALASIIELIHTATLLHDDVVDNAEERRGFKTANKVFGNEASVLVGDFLYSKAFQILTDISQPTIMKVLAETTNAMAEGEALQLAERFNPHTQEEAYLKVIRAKTAKLFEACTVLPAILSNAPAIVETAMAGFGLHLGMAFQLMDDVLDYHASSQDTGKELGNDLSQGKVTLPLIYVLQQANDKERDLLHAAIKEGGNGHLSFIQKIIEQKGGIQHTQNYARKEIQKAQACLTQLPDSIYREAAFALSEFALDRKY